MNSFKIKDTDIVLINEELGKGKIIVSDNSYGNFAYYWGAMGNNLENFLLRINPGYFANNLCNNKFSFSARQSVRNVRKYIKEEMSYELPWHKFMEAQKVLRAYLKEVEQSFNDREFVSMMEDITDNIKYNLPEMNYHDKKEFLEVVKTLENEPWHFIENEKSLEYKWLESLLPKIQKQLKKINHE